MGQQAPGQRAPAGELARRLRAELLELGLVPVLLGRSPGGHLSLQGLAGLQQARVLGVFGDLVESLFPSGDLNVVFVGQGEDVSPGVELRAPGAPEDLVGAAGVDHPLLARGPFDDAGQHDASGRQVDAGRERLGAGGDGEQLPLEQLLDDPAILGQHARVVNAHAAQQEVPQLGPGPFGEVVVFQLLGQPGLLVAGQDPLALDLLGHAPALLAVEAEDQGGRAADLLVAGGHVFELLGQQRVGHPVELQRHAALAPLDQLHAAVVAGAEPVDEFQRVSHRGRKQQNADVLGQKA